MVQPMWLLPPTVEGSATRDGFTMRAATLRSPFRSKTQLSAVAEVAGPEKRKELWARLLSIAPFYAGYEKRASREIPMVILRPVDEQRR